MYTAEYWVPVELYNDLRARLEQAESRVRQMEEDGLEGEATFANLADRLERAEARCKQLEGIAYGAFFEGWRYGSPSPHAPPAWMMADWDSSQTKQALSPTTETKP